MAILLTNSKFIPVFEAQDVGSTQKRKHIALFFEIYPESGIENFLD